MEREAADPHEWAARETAHREKIAHREMLRGRGRGPGPFVEYVDYSGYEYEMHMDDTGHAPDEWSGEEYAHGAGARSVHEHGPRPRRKGRGTDRGSQHPPPDERRSPEERYRRIRGRG